MSRPRSVQFALEKDYKIHTVLSSRDYSSGEKARVWLTPAECRIMKRSASHVVLQMEERAVSISACTRGLEGKTEKGAMDKKVAVLDGICAVLLEQERQRQDGRNSVDCIRSVYIEQTQIHANAALERGTKDAKYESEPEVAPFVQKELPRTRGRGRIERLLSFKRKRGGNSTDWKTL
jgi:hypothetical protein